MAHLTTLRIMKADNTLTYSSVSDPVAHCRKLIQCESVTPRDDGALDYLQTILTQAGFVCHRLPFSEAGTDDVDNLYARYGASGPHLCFAGHTDVVPPGDLTSWQHPPFEAVIEDGTLYGRGAVDMKGGIACFLAATLDVIASYAKQNIAFPGSISFLITGDEEGPAINGTQKVLNWLKSQNETIDHCLVGEPTNPEQLGDMIKIGRRGSLNGTLIVKGKQGHVAYPQLALNPVHGLLSALNACVTSPLDEGTAFFAPSNLEITSIDVGNAASNIIPEQAVAKFNIRFNDVHTPESLKEWLRQQVGEVLAPTRLTHMFRFQKPSVCFLTEPCLLSDVLISAVQNVTQKTPELSTSGGTSDARFIKDYCPVIEFGLVNKTIHQINERLPLEDLYALTQIYRKFIETYFDKMLGNKS